MDVIAGTRNSAKISEFQRLVGDSARIIAPPSDFRDIDPPEQGESFVENAAAKALVWSQRLRDAGIASLVIASDGGLLVPSLPSWNPLWTRRFAGSDATDQERAERLIDMAGSLEGDERVISWEEVVAIADQGDIVGVWSAESEPGILARSVDRELVDHQPGFWIPAIWLVPRWENRPLATLSADERGDLDDHWRQLQRPVRHALVTIGQIARFYPVRASGK